MKNFVNTSVSLVRLLILLLVCGLQGQTQISLHAPTNHQEENAQVGFKSSPTPLLIATGAGPTPTPVPTEYPYPGFSDCMRDCIAASYPPSEYPLFDTCFDLKTQGGVLVACGLGCGLTGPAWPGCVGGCYAIAIAVCMGVSVLPFTATAAGCAWYCWT